MNIKRKAKKFAKMLQLIVGAIILTSCGKENINNNDNEIRSTSLEENNDVNINIYWPSKKANEISNEQGSEKENGSEDTKEIHFLDEEREVIKYLEDNDIQLSFYKNANTIWFAKYTDNEVVIDDERVYAFINSAIREYDITQMVIIGLEREIDFERVDLSQIETMDLGWVGYDFDYTPFIEYYANRNSVDSMNILVRKENNHANRLNFLKSIPFKDNSQITFFIEQDVDLETATSYINNFDYNKISQLQITYNRINELDLKNISVSKLTLITELKESLINYDVELNKDVEYLTLGAFIYEGYEKNAIIDTINVKSLNNGLTITFITRNQVLYDTAINAKVNENTVISVPNNSNLFLVSVEENNITKEFLEQLIGLNNLSITNNANDYQYDYKNGKWSYYIREDEKLEEQEKKLLKELD